MAINLSYMRRRMGIEAQPHKVHATGDIVTFTTNRALKFPSLLVDVNPVQDLHGQANPYPAGGGKNMVKVAVQTQTINDVVFTIDSDGVIDVHGTASAQTYICLDMDGIMFADGVQYIIVRSETFVGIDEESAFVPKAVLISLTIALKASSPTNFCVDI